MNMAQMLLGIMDKEQLHEVAKTQLEKLQLSRAFIERVAADNFDSVDAMVQDAKLLLVKLDDVSKHLSEEDPSEFRV